MTDPCAKEPELARMWAEIRKAMNGKIVWQAAFWVLTVGLLILGTNMVANDRIRAAEDIRLSSKIDFNSNAVTTNTTLIKTIDNRLTRIELKLDRVLADS